MIKRASLSSYCYFAARMFSLCNDKFILYLDSVDDFYLNCTCFTKDIIKSKCVIVCNFIANNEVKDFGIVFDLGCDYSSSAVLFPFVYDALLYCSKSSVFTICYRKCVRFFSILSKVAPEFLLTYFYCFIISENVVSISLCSYVCDTNCDLNTSKLSLCYSGFSNLLHLVPFMCLDSMVSRLDNPYLYYHLVLNRFLIVNSGVS